MSLENRSTGEIYKQQAPSVTDGGGAAPTQSGEVGGNEKRKKRVIHFADGSTMEDYDDDDEPEPRTVPDSMEQPIRSVKVGETQSEPPIDTSKMLWSEWMRHYSSKAGTKTLTVLEGMGGTAAYYLGITTPKYQSEIDEYNRMVAKKKTHEEELVSWSTGPKTSSEEPVVTDVQKESIEMTEK